MCGKPQIPWVSLVLAAAAVALYPSPLLQQWLEFDRQAVAAGELWRVVTCHWTHWSPEHLFWDAGMFFLLAAVWEFRSRRSMLITVAVSAAVIPLVLWHLQPEMTRYRGLSGLDSALFFLVVVSAATHAFSRRQWPQLVALALLVAGFTAKIGYETFQGTAVFVHTGDFTPVPLAHVVGAVVGLVIGLLSWGAGMSLRLLAEGTAEFHTAKKQGRRDARPPTGANRQSHFAAPLARLCPHATRS